MLLPLHHNIYLKQNWMETLAVNGVISGISYRKIGGVSGGVTCGVDGGGSGGGIGVAHQFTM